MTAANFASAQQRLEARRRQREIKRQAFVSANDVNLVATTGHPRSSLQNPIDTILRAWAAVRGREGTRPAFRVGQVDAELLDEELLGLLQVQAGEALKYYGVGFVSPELFTKI